MHVVGVGHLLESEAARTYGRSGQAVEMLERDAEHLRRRYEAASRVGRESTVMTVHWTGVVDWLRTLVAEMWCRRRDGMLEPAEAQFDAYVRVSPTVSSRVLALLTADRLACVSCSLQRPSSVPQAWCMPTVPFDRRRACCTMHYGRATRQLRVTYSSTLCCLAR